LDPVGANAGLDAAGRRRWRRARSRRDNFQIRPRAEVAVWRSAGAGRHTNGCGKILGEGGASVGRRDTACRARGPRAQRSSVLSLPLVRARIRCRAASQRARVPPFVLAALGLFTGRRDKVWADSRVPSSFPGLERLRPEHEGPRFVLALQRGASLLAPARVLTGRQVDTIHGS